MFEQRTLKSLAEQIHQMKGSVGPVPKPKDKPTAIKILEKLIAKENSSFVQKNSEADSRVSELPNGVIGDVLTPGRIDQDQRLNDLYTALLKFFSEKN